MNNYESISLFIQFLIFIATGVYAGLAYGQWKAIRATLKVTQDQKRPLIMVTPDKPEGWPLSSGPSLSFQFTWSAHNVRTKFCSYWYQQGYSPVGPPSYIEYT